MAATGSRAGGSCWALSTTADARPPTKAAIAAWFLSALAVVPVAMVVVVVAVIGVGRWMASTRLGVGAVLLAGFSAGWSTVGVSSRRHRASPATAPPALPPVPLPDVTGPVCSPGLPSGIWWRALGVGDADEGVGTSSRVTPTQCSVLPTASGRIVLFRTLTGASCCSSAASAVSVLVCGPSRSGPNPRIRFRPVR
jgi:hypothetical protein